MSYRRNLTRRRFLYSSAGAAAGIAIAPLFVPASALGRDGSVAASERITLGMIGTGDHGVNRNVRRFLTEPDAMILAVCDVDRQRRLDAKQLIETRYAETLPSGVYRACDEYNDFREIIARDDIDAVMVSTPDHWHVIPSVMAANAGMDVMCEKPLSLTLREGRILCDAIEKNDRVFQTATENRSIGVYHRMAELVRNGRIGKLHTIHVGLPEGFWTQEACHTIQPVPEGFDYDLWLGPAPEKPYSPARCHWNFRWIKDYSGGMLTDWGAHVIDLAHWGADTEYTGPETVVATGEFPPEGELYDAPTQFHVECEYSNGVKIIIESKQPSIRYEGDEGWIGSESWTGELKASSEAILESRIGDDEIRLRTCPEGEQRDFLNCVKSRELCYAPAEIGHRTISVAHLGLISMTLGRKLRWDAERELCIDDPGANEMLSRPCRAPWDVEKLALGLT